MVQASRYFTKEENGLLYEWDGRVWMNPPYGKVGNKSNAGLFVEKVIREYRAGRVEQAIVLVNADTDTRWFQPLWAFPICFTNGRVNFYTAKRIPRYRNTHGSAFVYLGEREDAFIATFAQFGAIVKRVPLSLNLSLPSLI